MILTLGRKKRTEHSQWVEAIANIEKLVSRAEVSNALDKAVCEIRETTRNKRVACSWSGGKDSIVLADICKKAGVQDYMFAHTELEYPAFLEWCMKNKPEGCQTINLGYDLDWLVEHPNMLFPNAKDAQRWMVVCQRKAFTECFFDKKLDMLIVGHRKADGNVVGEGNILKKNSGEVRYSPLAEWPHELLLGYIHYFKLELPPIYKWKDGFRQGTHSWAGRTEMKSIEQGYNEVYEIDSQIIIDASRKLESARLYLERKMINEN